MSSKKAWTNEELEFVICNAPRMTDEELAEALGRTKDAVNKKIYRENALRRHENEIRTKNANGSWGGCNQDCFNCTYNDCRMPTTMAPIGMRYSEEGIKEMIKKEETR